MNNMRNEQEIEEQISTAIDVEATLNPTHPSRLRAEGIRQALDWVIYPIGSIDQLFEDD